MGAGISPGSQSTAAAAAELTPILGTWVRARAIFPCSQCPTPRWWKERERESFCVSQAWGFPSNAIRCLLCHVGRRHCIVSECLWDHSPGWGEHSPYQLLYPFPSACTWGAHFKANMWERSVCLTFRSHMSKYVHPSKPKWPYCCHSFAEWVHHFCNLHEVFLR